MVQASAISAHAGRILHRLSAPIREVLASKGVPPAIPGRNGIEAAPISTRAKAPAIRGSFPPPPGTLLIGVDRQPNGYTCGPETFQGLADFLRLPLRSPDAGTEELQARMGTTGQYGTEPGPIAACAREYLGIRARVQRQMTIRELAGLVNGSQKYVDELLAGKTPTKPLPLVMVTYQAYIEERKRSRFKVDGAIESLPVRSKDGRILWENDYSDGHYSAVVRVVMPSEHNVIRRLAQKGTVPYAALKDGVVILADPSNGLGLSFIPLPEFDKRWQDSNRESEPVFQHTAIVLFADPEKLKQMQRAAGRAGVPMFKTDLQNSVSYVS